MVQDKKDLVSAGFNITSKKLPALGHLVEITNEKYWKSNQNVVYGKLLLTESHTRSKGCYEWYIEVGIHVPLTTYTHWRYSEAKSSKAPNPAIKIIEKRIEWYQRAHKKLSKTTNIINNGNVMTALSQLNVRIEELENLKETILNL